MAETTEKWICDEMSDRIVETAERLVTLYGAHEVTVKDILNELQITNRVFYNRFPNIKPVLEIVYKNAILKIRECVKDGLDSSKDFFTQILDIVEQTLVLSYETKRKFSNYIFESDSVSQGNFRWWTKVIKDIIENAIACGNIKQVDSDTLSYAVWCFIRGYNADAVSRNIPKEEAVKHFRYSFQFFLEGLKA